jgi:hypothetical protein
MTRPLAPTLSPDYAGEGVLNAAIHLPLPLAVKGWGDRLPAARSHADYSFTMPTDGRLALARGWLWLGLAAVIGSGLLPKRVLHSTAEVAGMSLMGLGGTGLLFLVMLLRHMRDTVVPAGLQAVR